MSDTLYEYYDDYNTVDTTKDTVTHWMAQTFTVGTVGENVDFNVTSVKARVYKVGTPGTLTVSIRGTSGGAPTGGDLTSDVRDATGFLTPMGQLEEFVFDSPVLLKAGTTYAIVLVHSIVSTLNYVGWRLKNPDPAYSGGNYYYNRNNAGWIPPLAHDGTFYVYGLAVIKKAVVGAVARKLGTPTPMNVGVGM